MVKVTQFHSSSHAVVKQFSVSCFFLIHLESLLFFVLTLMVDCKGFPRSSEMIAVTLAKPHFILLSQSMNFKLFLPALWTAVRVVRNFREVCQGSQLADETGGVVEQKLLCR